MESVHGVDVSWLHRPYKEPLTRSRAPSSPAAPRRDDPLHSPATPPSPGVGKAGTESNQDNAKPIHHVTTEPLPSKSSPKLQQGLTTTTVESSAPRSGPRRPGLRGRASQEKLGSDSRVPRRGSWISNISSRFSSANAPAPGHPASPQLSRPAVNGTHAPSPQPDLEKVVAPVASPVPPRREAEEMLPYVPQKPRESSGNFFSSLTRRLSSNTQTSPVVKVPDNGGVCPRRTMNVNHQRTRCHIAELDPAKLRRVSFSVDVEIAGGPRYKDADATADRDKKIKDKKLKERAEGEALKRPQRASDLKDGEAQHDVPIDEALARTAASEDLDRDTKLDSKGEKSKGEKPLTRKQEKKKRSEEERKERKEKQRRRAEENGQIPLEVSLDDASKDSSSLSSTTDTTPAPQPKSHGRPTTDPVRIYRRCCQLRESPILKRITEQLMKPTCTVPGDPGTVNVLNLTGSRLQLADFITLGDWLAIVPVKRLLLEDADITDEGLRVVLAGLLAAKKPEPTRARHRDSDPFRPTSKAHHERAGVVERLNLKNNPRVTRSGWKHLALFLNMCRSIKAIDLSMIQFPDDLPPGPAHKYSPRPDDATGIPDAADIISKALAERQGGSRLEELILSGCGLKSDQIRKIVDGAIASGISRLGFAGSNLDDDGFEHILNFVRSSVCHVVDIGHNDLNNGRMDKLADALGQNPDSEVWGLSLASGNLDGESLASLLPALVKLKNFRFLDLSHNKGLFENGKSSGVHLLRRYIPQMKDLKRIHLDNVGMNAKQAIALAEILPEGPSLAHLSILENADLSRLVADTDEESQEEACALYASLMAAVRVSSTIICVDVDVPPPDNSEVVKALAKQVVAYCLRNMERMPLPSSTSAETASSALAPAPRGLSAGLPSPPTPHSSTTTDITVPEVLLHLVDHVDGAGDDANADDPAPDADYIVGGTGVVRALSYCLGEKAQDLGRGSATASGEATPRDSQDPGGRDMKAQSIKSQEALQHAGRAKEVSKNLLGSARRIRARLQPALVREAATGEEMAYRRLVFLDNTLQGMIARFEDEYPECRLEPPASSPSTSSSRHSESQDRDSSSGGPDPSRDHDDAALHDPAANPAVTADDNISDPDDETTTTSFLRPSRRSSEVSLAGRALAIQEGRMHRIGHGIRRDLADPCLSPPSLPSSPDPSNHHDRLDRRLHRSPSSPPADEDDDDDDDDDDDADDHHDAAAGDNDDSEARTDAALEGIDAHLKELARRMQDLAKDGGGGSDQAKGVGGGGVVDGGGGDGDDDDDNDDESNWEEAVMRKIGASIEELRSLKRRDPEGWRGFLESQRAARVNVGS